MQESRSGENDSHALSGGSIPGAFGEAAFTLTERDPSPIPILIAAPHAGRIYPESLIERLRSPDFAALRLEDRHVDRVAMAVAQETGAATLIAHAPRAMIDLNRSVDEMDWGMVAHGAPFGRAAGQAARVRGNRRVRGGLGLVPRRLSDLGELWKRPMELAELDSRIACIHAPYHDVLARKLDDLRARWGAALLIDLHSMPPLGRPGSDVPIPHFVVGDRFGASCGGILSAAVFDEFAQGRWRAAHNRPYAGGYVLDRHASPGRALHAMQIEICRTTYLDSQLLEIGHGFDRIVGVLVKMVRRLASEVSMLGRSSQWPQAAE